MFCRRIDSRMWGSHHRPLHQPIPCPLGDPRLPRSSCRSSHFPRLETSWFAEEWPKEFKNVKIFGQADLLCKCALQPKKNSHFHTDHRINPPPRGSKLHSTAEDVEAYDLPQYTLESMMRCSMAPIDTYCRAFEPEQCLDQKLGFVIWCSPTWPASTKSNTTHQRQAGYAQRTI